MSFNIDFDSQKDLLKKFNVQKQSTLIVFKGKQEAGRSTGDTNAGSIDALVEQGDLNHRRMGGIGLALLAGILSTLSPCVLPLMPIVLGAALGEHRYGPVALAAGLSLSFVVIGLFVATVGFAAGLDQEVFRRGRGGAARSSSAACC